MSPSPAPTILVADDEHALLGLMGRILERAGYRVLRALDGDEALELFRSASGAIAAAILDVTLPPAGGLSALREMRATQPDLGVVLVSGASLDAETREVLLACGGTFVSKPFSPRALTQALDEVRSDGTH
ncbi:MAG: response regulator [Myxococcales bacterium]|nr:response regulator [Myxococcales bacterium]